jgi:predicted MFS family arabinose efflux permease
MQPARGVCMSRIDSKLGASVLTLCHVAGMVDMVALPLWIGALMQFYGFSAPQAGITVTLFLAAVVVSSLVLASRFNRLPRRAMVSGGFFLAAAAFLGASGQPLSVDSLPVMVGLHVLAGLGVGSALSMTHGSIGRSSNPHRLFAVVNVLLGVFAIVFLAGVPQLIAKSGASQLFVVFGATMTVAGLVALAAFPQTADEEEAAPTAPMARFSPATWFVIGAVACLTLNQAMVFSFVERVGAERGFGAEKVQLVLIALGLVNLLPGALAALLQKRLSPTAVGMAGPVLQALLALTLSGSETFAPYAVASALYVSIVIFTHTFLFGLLSQLDRSGRAVAGTPAMMMIGSCLGPAMGGGVVHTLGYQGLGWAACMVAGVAVTLMLLARARLRDTPTLNPSDAEVAF